jgi:hypothetical protein
MKHHIGEILETKDRQELYRRSEVAQGSLHELLMGKAKAYGDAEWELFLNKLGLTSRPVSQLFGKDSAKVRFIRDGLPDRNYVPRIEVHSVRPAFRSGREGRQIEQVLITLTQRVSADIGDEGQPHKMVFRGGCSLILSLGNLNQVEYVIQKNIKSYERFQRQAAYARGDDESAAALAASLYANDDRDWRLDFNLLHRH